MNVCVQEPGRDAAAAADCNSSSKHSNSATSLTVKTVKWCATTVCRCSTNIQRERILHRCTTFHESRKQHVFFTYAHADLIDCFMH